MSTRLLCPQHVPGARAPRRIIDLAGSVFNAMCIVLQFSVRVVLMLWFQEAVDMLTANLGVKTEELQRLQREHEERAQEKQV
mgnify:CR=1 FL=1